MNSSVKTAVYAVSILFASGLMAYLLKVTAPSQAHKVRLVAPAQVYIYRLKKQSLSPQIHMTGRLQPAHKAGLKFELSGPVAKRLVEPGQKVAKGAVLLQLSDGDYRDAYTEAKAQYALESAGVDRDKRLLELAQHNSNLQQKEVLRLSRLGKRALVSKSSLGQGRQKLYQLKAEEARLKYKVDTAQARLSLRKSAMLRAKRNLDRTQLIAPFDGIINSVSVQKGDVVPVTKQVVEIVSVDQLEMQLQVRTSIATALKLGDKVDVHVQGRKVLGTMIALQADPDATTYTHLLRIRFPGSVGSPGLLAEVNLNLGKINDVIAIPAAAVIQSQGSAYVMVVSDKKVQRRSIVLGKRVKDWQIVRKGLEIGEVIVKSDTSGLKDNQDVSVQQH